MNQSPETIKEKTAKFNYVKKKKRKKKHGTVKRKGERDCVRENYRMQSQNVNDEPGENSCNSYHQELFSVMSKELSETDKKNGQPLNRKMNKGCK